MGAVLILGALAPVATAEPATDRSAANLATFQAASDALLSSQSTRTASSTRTPSQTSAGDTCVTDASGDTVNNDTDAATSEPRADLLEQCVAYGPTLSVKARVARPTDPTTDAGWQRGTFVGWFLDTDADGEGEFFVDFSLDVDGELQGRVLDIRTEEQKVACTAVASFSEYYTVHSIEPACIGGSTRVSASAGVFYDDGTVVHRDVLRDGAFPAAVTQTATRAKNRLAGATRIETSVAISKRQFRDGAANAVYLARQDVFADAVAGGSVTDGPILLVPTCGTLPSVVAAEIRRVTPNYVVALGGPNAVCPDLLTQAARQVDPSGNAKKRLAGPTRIDTSVAISRALYANPDRADVVYLARQDVFADAVAAGVLTDGPVLLVPTCGAVPATVRDEVNRISPSRVIALGGPNAICDQVLRDASGSHPTGRIFGATRFETAIAISQRAFEQGAEHVFLARADVLVDAVAGGVLTGGPILLVPSCGELPDTVAAEISRVAPRAVTALGGPNAICEAVLDAAAKA